MHPRLRRSCLGIFLALMLLTTLPACGVRQLTTGEIQPPKVTFQGIAFGRPTPGGWPLAVMLLLTNPNSQALNLRGTIMSCGWRAKAWPREPVRNR